MNKEHVNAAIRLMRQVPVHKFNMAEWCGTPCCTAGWINKELIGHVVGMSRTCEYLGITEGLGARLFMPPSLDYEKVKPKQAVRALMNLRDKGDPRWDEIFPEKADDYNRGIAAYYYNPERKGTFE